MYEAAVIPTEHKNIIHDISFDFYGRRMATCSSDRTVKIWDLDESGEWKCSAEWQTHSGSICKVTWAHPEFGQVIATCSFDRTALVYEEQVGMTNGSSSGDEVGQWIQIASLVDTGNSVTDIKFSPKHLGLKLALCYKDGAVRIYEAPDVMNLSHWSVQHVINCKLSSACCLSWNPSRAHPPMIAVGSNDSTPGLKVELHEYSSSTRKWSKIAVLNDIIEPVNDISFAPNLGRSHHLLAIATKDLIVLSIEPTKEKVNIQQGVSTIVKPDIKVVANLRDHESTVWRVAWNVTGTILSSTGDDGKVRLWKGNQMKNWHCIAVLNGDQSNNPTITSTKENGSLHQHNSINLSEIQNIHPIY